MKDYVTYYENDNIMLYRERRKISDASSYKEGEQKDRKTACFGK